MTFRCSLLVAIALTVTAHCQAQDLRPTALSCTPSTFQAGQTVTLQSTIKNQGQLRRVGASQGAYYLSVDPVLGNRDDVRLATFATPALAKGNSYKNTKTVRMPSGIVSGAYSIFVKADYNNQVKESIELNNSRRITVRGTATDLTAAIATAVQVTAGSTVNAALTIANAGTLKSMPTTALLFASPDPRLDTADVFLGSVAVPAIDGLRQFTVRVKVTLPRCRALYTLTGKTQLGVIVNAHKRFPESEYRNNVGRTGAAVGAAAAGRILEWRPRYSVTNLGPRTPQAARLRAAAGVKEQLCVTAPGLPSHLYLLLWSASPSVFAYDLYTTVSLGSLNSPLFLHWFGILDGEGTGPAIALALPKLAGVHGFTVYTHHFYFTPDGRTALGFGENAVAAKFEQ